MLKNIERYLKNFRKDFKKLYEYEYHSTYGLDYLFNQLNEEDYYEPREVNPPGMHVVATSHLGLISVETSRTMLRRHRGVSTGTSMRLTYLRRLCDVSLVRK